MEEKKTSVSLPVIIIIVVILLAIIFGLAFYILFNMNSKDNSQPESTPQKEMTTEKMNVVSTPEIQPTNDIPILDTTTTENNNTISENNTTSESTAITGKTSSKASPLSIGEWGIGSKYSSGNYVDVPVKVTNVTRGSSATAIVKDFCDNKSSIYKYEDAKEGMEWAVINYTVDLTNITAYSNGEKSIKVDSKITGAGDNTSIKYNNKIYIVSTMNMTTGNTKESIANGSFAVQLPIGCTDYLIALGSYSHTQAFFQGK